MVYDKSEWVSGHHMDQEGETGLYRDFQSRQNAGMFQPFCLMMSLITSEGLALRQHFVSTVGATLHPCF
jgi:hypothetical protein